MANSPFFVPQKEVDLIDALNEEPNNHTIVTLGHIVFVGFLCCQEDSVSIHSSRNLQNYHFRQEVKVG